MLPQSAELLIAPGSTAIFLLCDLVCMVTGSQSTAFVAVMSSSVFFIMTSAKLVVGSKLLLTT